MYDADLLFTLRYDRKSSLSFAGMFDQALHLVTNYKAIQTARQNLNFIFSDRESHESQWMHLYTRLPLLLAYAVDLSTVLVGGILEVPMPHLAEGMLHRQIALGLWNDDCAYLKTGRMTVKTAQRILRALDIRCTHCNRLLGNQRGLDELYMKHSFRCTFCKRRTSLTQIVTRDF